MEALLIASVVLNLWLLYEVRQANKKYLDLKMKEIQSRYLTNTDKPKRVYTKDLSNPRWQPKKRVYRKNPNNPYWKGRLA